MTQNDRFGATHPPDSLLLLVASSLVTAVFGLLAVYYGSSFNVTVFLVAWVLFLIPWLLVVPARIAEVWRVNRLLCSGFLLSALLIMASYLGSISKESSFSASLGLALCPLAFVLSACLPHDARSRMLRWLRGVVLIFAAVSAWQLVSAGVRAYQPLSEPNAYAALLYLTALPWMHQWLGSRRAIDGWRDSGQLLVFALFSIAVFATISRVGTFVLFSALFFWLASAWVTGRRNGRAVWWRHGALAIVVVSMFLASIALLDGGLATELADGPVDESIGVRGFLVTSGLQALDGSLIGTGIYTFPLLYPSVRTDADISSAGLYIHNDYVQFLLEGGPGLALMLVLFLVWIVVRFVSVCGRLWRTGRWDPEVGVLMAIGCALAHAIVNFVFYVPILALLIGLLAGSLAREPVASVPHARLTRFSLVTAVGAGLAGIGLAFFLVIETLNAGILGGQARIPFAASCAQDDECRLRFAERSSQFNPEWGTPHLARAVLLEQQHFDFSNQRAATNELILDQSLAGYRRALEADPWSPQTYLQFRAFLDRHPELGSQLQSHENPVSLLQRALELDPYNVFAVSQVVIALESIGRPAEAQAFLLDHLENRIANFGQRFPEDAEYFLNWLESSASDQPEVLRQIGGLRAKIVVSPFEFSQRWWPR